MKHDQSTTTTTVKQRLDQSAAAMGEKHGLRLEQMTLQAVARYTEKPQNNYRQFAVPFAIPLAMATSLMFVVWLWWPLNDTTAPQGIPPVAVTASSKAGLPEWVTDTTIPLSLLNNMEFYDWLAKQTENQNHG